MTRQFDVDRVIEDWLADLPNSLPDRVVDRLVYDLDRTPQWRRFGLPWRDEMNRFVMTAGAVAAIALLAVIGIYLASGGSGLFGPGATPAATGTAEPTAAPTPQPTQTPSPTASPRPAPDDGAMDAGTYYLQPLRATNPTGNPLSVTFTVPEGWGVAGGSAIVRDAPPNNIVIQFEDITSLNGDPCHWSGTADDIDAGTTVNDLAEALEGLDGQNALDVSIGMIKGLGGYSGLRIDIDFPTESFEECDEAAFMLWSSAIHGEAPLYAQGPANQWQTYILDVEGTRLVVVAMDFPETSAQDRAELESVLHSIVIHP